MGFWELDQIRVFFILVLLHKTNHRRRGNGDGDGDGDGDGVDQIMVFFSSCFLLSFHKSFFTKTLSPLYLTLFELN